MRVFLFLSLFFVCDYTFASIKQDSQKCTTDLVTIDFNFSGGGNSVCEVISSDHIKILVKPESKDSINPSPWYAFRKSKHIKKILLELDYGEYEHRYFPKIKKINSGWERLNKSDILIKNDGKNVFINFYPSKEDQYISSQELITEDWYEDWYKILKKNKFLKSKIIGYSVQNRPIKAFFSNENINNPFILILGRQHPPEVSSAFALQGFINQLIGSINLSKDFLSKYNIIFVPLMNPDGVENGFWRYNFNKKDLNRDWDNFSQPETYSVKNFLDNLKNKNQPFLFIDFHSTYKNIFYISDAKLKNSEQNFLLNWLEKSRLELSKINYNFTVKNSYTESNKVSKNYFYNQYNIPSMTYEVSDSEIRSVIIESSRILAKELMIILLDTNRKNLDMAERKGFEPSRRLPAYTLSKRAPSTTRPPLH